MLLAQLLVHTWYLFLGDAATALVRNSGVSVTLAVDKRASAKCAVIVTPRVDGLAICNQTDPSAARDVATVRATTRSNIYIYIYYMGPEGCAS